MWLLAFFLVVVVLVLLEGKRQEKKYGKSSGQPSLMGAGFLELQKILQPDRKVEILQQKEAEEVEQDEAGEGKKPGRKPGTDSVPPASGA